MPKITKELTVDAPIESVWQLVSDMERFSSCIPGCKQVRRVSETEFDWVLEARVLRTTRKLTARTRAMQMCAPRRAEFCGEGRLFEQSNHYRLSLQGTTDLQDLGGGRTRVRFEAQINASGMGGAIVDKIAAGQMDELFGSFEDNMKRALAGTSGADRPIGEAPAGTEGPAAESGGSASRRQRLFASVAVLIVLLVALLLWASR